MGTSKLRHTPHGRQPDDRDRPVLRNPAQDLRDAGIVPAASSDLDAPLPDSAEAEQESRYWDDIRSRLERLLHDPDLSERTQEFLESLDEQLGDRGALTSNQVNAIVEIEDRRDSGRRRY